MNQLKCLILAAGKGTRMKSDLPKVLHEIDGKAMVEYVMEAAKCAGADSICLVVGHGADLVKERIGENAEYRLQAEQLGTGHAVRCAADYVGEDGDILILCGDTPIITAETLKNLVAYHREKGYDVTVLSTELADATGYGRIVRDPEGAFLRIVEQKDATPEEAKIREINAGMYVFRCKALSDALQKLTNHNAQGEYYLTDTIEILRDAAFGKAREAVGAFLTDRIDETRGVNTTEQLEEAATIIRGR